MCSDAPDTKGMNKAAAMNAQTAQEALEFYKGVYTNDLLPMQKEQAALSQQLQKTALDTQTKQNAFADQQREFYTDTYKPLQQQVVDEAKAYDSEANVAARSGKAAANVSQQFSNSAAQKARLMGRYGMNVNSSAFAAQAGADSRAQALATADASTKAAFDTKDKAIALRAGAANMGNGATNSAANFYAGGNQSGASAMGMSQAGMQGVMSSASLMGQGFNTNIAGNQSAGNLYGQAAQLDSSGNGLAQIAGLGMQMYQASSKRLKNNKRPLSPSQALRGIRGLNSEAWDYKPGAGDGGRHIGPYAEDVQRELGDAVAPGGKMINMREAARANTLAIKALANKAERISALLDELEAA